MDTNGAKPKSLHFDAACVGGANIYYNVSDGKTGGPQLTSDIANPAIIDPEIVETLDEDNRLTRDYVDRVLDAVENGNLDRCAVQVFNLLGSERIRVRICEIAEKVYESFNVWIRHHFAFRG
jgi:hypothetical protein